MKVLVVTEGHFIDVDGAIFSRSTADIFRTIFRCLGGGSGFGACVTGLRSTWQGASPISMRGVKLIGLPDFAGPLQYFMNRRRIHRIIRPTLQAAESILFRVPGVVNTAVLRMLPDANRPFGVEVLGDPRSALASMRHFLRPLFQWYYARDLRGRCQQAFASAYVTQEFLQKLYPPNPNRFSTSYSDVHVRNSDVLEHPRQSFSSSESIPPDHGGDSFANV